MIDRKAITEMANSDPKFAQAVDMMEEQLAREPIVPEDLDQMIQILEFVLENPDKYQEVVQAALADGEIEQGIFPPQFDQVFVVSLLVALYGIQDRMAERGYARGGLAVAARRVAAAGRGGDTQLAHINRREAEMLKRAGGSGKINPQTGLHEYKFSFKKILGAILPIALNFIAPGIGTAIGTALGASGAMASALGSAVIGGASSALTGGNPLLGAALGGIGGGFGGMAGSAINDALGLNLGSTAQSLLGGGLLGAGAGALAGGGKGALMGALMGGIGSGINAMGTTMGPEGTTGEPGYSGNAGKTIEGAGQDFMKADYDQLVAQGKADPGQLGAVAKAASAAASPSKSVFDSLKAAASGDLSGMSSLIKYTPLVLAAGSLLTSPPEVKQAVSSLSPDQQAYFNRPSVSWDWDRLQADANAENVSLQQYMARNWDAITSGEYNQPVAVAQNPSNTVQMARGGLSQVAYLARGAGTGRSDEIPARLSDGEYVMDAETVAMIGDGSTDAGSKRLDEMRSAIRKHKGKALSKGKFSPNAKSPLAYLKGVA
jgi:hypothetical protein